jgi:hypothetical protein
MKLGKTSLIFFVIGVIIAAWAGLGVARAQQLKEQDRVADELTIANRRLNTLQIRELQTQRGELQEKLNQTTAEFEALEAIFAQQPGNIDANDAVFQIASSCNVTINHISSSGATPTKFAGIPCNVITISLSVEGYIDRLIEFVMRLNDDFVTGTVNSVSVSNIDTTTGQNASTSINLTIYTYQDD